MVSVLRQNITRKVLSVIKPVLIGDDYPYLMKLIPKSMLLVNEKDSVPQLDISWNELLKINPEFNKKLHPDTFYTLLKNQEFDDVGVTDLIMKNASSPSFSFALNQHVFNKTVLLEIAHNLEDLGNRSSFFVDVPGEEIVVEFSSPNIAKPFHYGHFRSTIVGNFIANIFSYVGHNVKRLNYIGDWGLQYGLLAVGFTKFGCKQKLLEDPLLHLYEVYTKANIKNIDDKDFNEEAKMHFQKMEEGNEETLAQWRNFRDLSLEKMADTYKRLGIEFDETHSESLYCKEAKNVVQELLNKSITVHGENNCIQTTILNENGTEETVVLQKSDGSTLYISRDIAAAIDRKNKLHFDSMYYVVDSSQSKHFRHLFHILKAMGFEWSDSLHHVSFGRILNFSTRKGNSVFLHDILNEAKERTLEKMKQSPNTKIIDEFEETAEILGISSLIVNDFSSRRSKAVNFDWEKVLNMDGNSGVSLQYCHARLSNIEKNCGIHLNLKSNLEFLVEPEANALVCRLAQFDRAVYQAYSELEPVILVHYLFNLKHHIGRANKVLTVKGQPAYIANARLLLFHCSRLVLGKGLEILGIKPLKEM